MPLEQCPHVLKAMHFTNYDRPYRPPPIPTIPHNHTKQKSPPHPPQNPSQCHRPATQHKKTLGKPVGSSGFTVRGPHLTRNALEEVRGGVSEAPCWGGAGWRAPKRTSAPLLLLLLSFPLSASSQLSLTWHKHNSSCHYVHQLPQHPVDRKSVV